MASVSKRIQKLAFLAFFTHSANFAHAVVPPEVLRHYPILISRKDQIKEPYTDRYLLLGYSIFPEENGDSRIRYTAYFSDEDSVKTSRQTEKQISRYGRRLDVEWLYEVLIDSKGDAKERKYHCSYTTGVGHHTCIFDGNFKSGTEHPMIFNIAKHNVFDSKPILPQGSSNGKVIELEPTLEIPFPKSRDMVPIENPEYLRISDEELAAEGKLAAPATEYAYVRIRGILKGDISVGLHGESPSKSVGTLKELGLDLWTKESVIGIRLSKNEHTGLMTGSTPFRFIVKGGNNNNRLTLDEVGLYLVTNVGPTVYKTLDLSHRIRCSDPKNIATCEI